MRGFFVPGRSVPALAAAGERGGLFRVAAGSARRLERLDRLVRLAGERELTARAVEAHARIDLGVEHDRLGAGERAAGGVEGSGQRAACAALLLLLRAGVCERDVEAVAQARDALVRR